MDKIQLLIYVSGFYFGGVEEFITNVLSEIDQNKVSPFLLCRYIDKKTNAYKKFEKLHIPVKSLNIKHLGMRNNCLFKKLIRRFLSEHHFDMAHVNGLGELFLINELKAKKIKIAVHVHEPRMEDASYFKRFVKNLVERNTIKKADYHLACSIQTGKQVYLKYGINNFCVVSNGIIVSRFKFNETKRKDIRAELAINDKAVVLGNVGRFTSVKNQNFIIDVFYQLYNISHDYKLLLVGDGEDMEKIRKKIIDLGITNEVLLVGEKNNVEDYLQAMDFYIMPSVFEGLGMALIEAQAAGVKCFVSSQIPEEAIITDLVTKISLEEKPETWAKYIDRSESNFDRIKYNDIVLKSEYNIANTCKQLENIYK